MTYMTLFDTIVKGYEVILAVDDDPVKRQAVSSFNEAVVVRDKWMDQESLMYGTGFYTIPLDPTKPVKGGRPVTGRPLVTISLIPTITLTKDGYQL